MPLFLRANRSYLRSFSGFDSDRCLSLEMKFNPAVEPLDSEKIEVGLEKRSF